MNSMLRLALNAYEYLLRKRKLSGPPIQVSLEPTNICNFKCPFCPQSYTKNGEVERGKMGLEQCGKIMERAIRDFYPDTKNRKVSFTHDGEPFVNEEFVEFLKLAHGMNCIIKFASNGYLATPDKIDKLVSSGVRFNICVDFTSEKELFDKYRGFGGSHETVLENLRYIMRKAADTGQIFVDICDITAYCVPDPEEQDKLFLKLKEMFQGLDSPRVKYSRRIFHNMTGTVKLPERIKRGGGKYRLCPYPWFNFNITWRGDVVPCCRDLSSKTVLGNVFEVDSLWDIWNSIEYQSLREALISGMLSKVEACRDCDLPYDNTRWAVGYILNAVKSRLLRTGRK